MHVPVDPVTDPEVSGLTCLSTIYLLRLAIDSDAIQFLSAVL